MRTLKRRRNVYLNAARLVQLAVQKGYSHEQIAKICGVTLGSVQRWVANNRADASKIKALEEEVGQTYLSAESVGDILIELYKLRGRRYRIKRVHLKRIAGRTTLRWAFVDELHQYLLDRRYFILEAVEADDDFFIIIRQGQLLKHVNGYLKAGDLKHYYKGLADKIEVDDEDND